MKIHWFITKISKGGQRDHNSKIKKWLRYNKINKLTQIDNFVQEGTLYTVVTVSDDK